jgi:tubulin polyglutamylase TTLL9
MIFKRRYGYDVLIDENLKPWLIEVNASPSLSVENQMDYEAKFMVLNEMLDIVDMEKKLAFQGGF